MDIYSLVTFNNRLSKTLECRLVIGAPNKNHALKFHSDSRTKNISRYITFILGTSTKSWNYVTDACNIMINFHVLGWKHCRNDKEGGIGNSEVKPKSIPQSYHKNSCVYVLQITTHMTIHEVKWTAECYPRFIQFYPLALSRAKDTQTILSGCMS